MSDFAKNLKHFRKQKKYSQMELAKELNYGYTAIANYESGRNEPSLDDLVRLAGILDVSLDELVGVEPKTIEERFIFAFKKIDHQKQEIILELLYALQP